MQFFFSYKMYRKKCPIMHKLFLIIALQILMLCISVQTTIYHLSFGNGYYAIDNKIIRFFCYDEDFQNLRLTNIFPRFSVISTFTEITIDSCFPTNTTYYAELQALNINASAVETLELRFRTQEPLPQGNYTERLLIKTLIIIDYYGREKHLLQNAQNFLEPLTNLKKLSAAMVQLPPLPESMRLVKLTLIYQASLKDWGNCRHLEILEMRGRSTQNPFPEIPKSCSKFKSLTIDSAWMYIFDFTKNLMNAVPSLLTLKINYCVLTTFTMKMLASANNITDLDLSYNLLSSTLFTYFPKCKTLRSLSLYGIRITIESIRELVPKLPSLREIYLGHPDTVTFLCNKSSASEALLNWSIEIIDLMNVDFDVSCLANLRFTNLKRFVMKSNKHDTLLNPMDFPKTDAGVLEVGLEAERLFFSFNETDYNILKGKIPPPLRYRHRNLTIYTKHPIWCDCEHGWLARALRQFPNIISMPGLMCFHGDNHHNSSTFLLDEPLEMLECDKTEDDDCVYRKSWHNGTVTAECKKDAWGKEELLQNIHALNISGRGLTSLRSKLPNKLQWLDLRRNAISRGSAMEAAALFAAGRRVWLDGNSLLCDCDNRALLDAIQQYHNQVMDYDLLKCAGSDEAIKDISTAVLCKTIVLVTSIILGVCVALAVIAGLIALLLRRYGEQLRMFLYSRGWFVSCLQREETDDKPYDAFLSFAHEDQEYVEQTLLPGLENAPEQFRVCVHYRDWPIGDWIPDQIMRSVLLSKRTLILLSKNFVASFWSTLEVRYSLANNTEDPNAKVLVLIKDDVLDMELDKTLRRYLTFNTYLRCDDPWFWEKLRYAMPHRLKKKHPENGGFDAGSRTTAEIIELREPIAVLPVCEPPAQNVQEIDEAD